MSEPYCNPAIVFGWCNHDFEQVRGLKHSTREIACLSGSSLKSQSHVTCNLLIWLAMVRTLFKHHIGYVIQKRYVLILGNSMNIQNIVHRFCGIPQRKLSLYRKKMNMHKSQFTYWVNSEELWKATVRLMLQNSGRSPFRRQLPILPAI